MASCATAKAIVLSPVPFAVRALSQFLDTLNHGWNVSLFHYRNHGADIGRVLVGVQVPPDEVPQHRAFLDRLGYVYHPETENPVYQQFMR